MFTDKTLFQKDPREYAQSMVDDGLIDAQSLLDICLRYLSHDDVRDMLDREELSPRFAEYD
jgi:hypothetical protein